MTKSEILYDAQQHEKWLHSMRQKYSTRGPIGVSCEHESTAHYRGIDAANTRAEREYDPESNQLPKHHRRPSLGHRLAAGFSMMKGGGFFD